MSSTKSGLTVNLGEDKLFDVSLAGNTGTLYFIDHLGGSKVLAYIASSGYISGTGIWVI